MEKIIKEAVEILKNNYSFHKRYNLSKKDRQKYREFMIGIYNRFDEIGLIYARLKDIGFNDAIVELELGDYMDELKEILSSSMLNKSGGKNEKK